jgi:hypothetical protein
METEGILRSLERSAGSCLLLVSFAFMKQGDAGIVFRDHESLSLFDVALIHWLLHDDLFIRNS